MERWTYDLSCRLWARGHNVQIVSLRFAPELNWHVSGKISSSIYSELRCTRFLRGAPFPSLLSLNDLIKRFDDSDIVYFFPYPPNEVILYILRRRLKLLHARFIGGLHGFLRQDILAERLYTYILKHSLRAFDALHVLNTYTLRLLRMWNYQKVYLIPVGIDTSSFTLCQPEDDNFEILFTGIHNKNKGIDTLAQIVRRVNESNMKAVKFVITGTGEFTSIVENLAEKYDNVEYAGYVPSHLLPKVYRNAHVLLSPSRLEGMPLRILEAQSCGVPTVASKIPGITDITEHGKTGLLVKTGDIDGFVAMLNKYYDLWKNFPEQYRLMNKEIRTHAVKNYDWRAVLDKFEGMLERERA